MLSALNACMTVGYVEDAAVRGSHSPTLRWTPAASSTCAGFLRCRHCSAGLSGIDYVVRIAGDGTPEQFAEIHAEVQATSPNYDNLARAIRMNVDSGNPLILASARFVPGGSSQGRLPV